MHRLCRRQPPTERPRSNANTAEALSRAHANCHTNCNRYSNCATNRNFHPAIGTFNGIYPNVAALAAGKLRIYVDVGDRECAA